MVAGPSSRRTHVYQHWDRIKPYQSKTSLIGGSPSPVKAQEFMKMVYLQQNNIPTGRMNKSHSINHLSVLAPQFIFSHIQNAENNNCTRSSALGPLIREKRSIDSGHQSALFSPTSTQPSSHASFNGRTGGVLVF